MRVDEALRPADAVVAGDEAALGKLEPPRRRSTRRPCVEGLPHRAELRLEAGGARRNEAQRIAGLLARQADDSGGRDRSAEGAGGRGLVEPAIVVPAAQYHADADRRLRPDEQRVEAAEAGASISSATASAAGRIATEGWPTWAKCVSS